MTIYEYLYNFYEYLLDSGNLSTSIDYFTFEIGGSAQYEFSGLDWLCHTFCIITIILFIVMFIKIAIWFFKMGANLFKW